MLYIARWVCISCVCVLNVCVCIYLLTSIERENNKMVAAGSEGRPKADRIGHLSWLSVIIFISHNNSIIIIIIKISFYLYTMAKNLILFLITFHQPSSSHKRLSKFVTHNCHKKHNQIFTNISIFLIKHCIITSSRVVGFLGFFFKFKCTHWPFWRGHTHDTAVFLNNFSNSHHLSNAFQRVYHILMRNLTK
jgi:hypothetical protein